MNDSPARVQPLSQAEATLSKSINVMKSLGCVCEVA